MKLAIVGVCLGSLSLPLQRPKAMVFKGTVTSMMVNEHFSGTQKEHCIQVRARKVGKAGR